MEEFRPARVVVTSFSDAVKGFAAIEGATGAAGAAATAAAPAAPAAAASKVTTGTIEPLGLTDSAYVLDCRQGTDGLSLFASLSNHTVKKYTAREDGALETVGVCAVHSDRISDLAVVTSDPHVLFTASLDGTVCAWDSRAGGKAQSLRPATVLRAPKQDQVWSASIGCNDAVVAMGTGESKGKGRLWLCNLQSGSGSGSESATCFLALVVLFLPRLLPLPRSARTRLRTDLAC